MTSFLSAEEVRSLEAQCPGRRAPLHQLSLYYNQYLPCPPILVAYGLESTGRLTSIISLLKITKIQYTLVKSRECLSQRHLLTKIFAACLRALGCEEEVERYDRVDSLNALSLNLQKLFANSGGKFVLVVDDIDRQKGSSSTLLAALARLGDMVPGFSILLTMSSYRTLPLHRSGVPYVHFPPYTRSEAIQLIQSDPPPLQPETLPENFPSIQSSALVTIYASYVRAVYDIIAVHTSSISIPSFRRSCETLWPRFIWPMLSNEPVPNQGQQRKTKITWDFARLLMRSRPLFQLQGEKALTKRLFSKSDEPWTFQQLIQQYNQKSTDQIALDAPLLTSQSQLTSSLSTSKSTSQPYRSADTKAGTAPLLKFLPTLVLLSSYLASHTQPKHDIILFSRLSSSSSHKRKYLSSALNRSKPRVRKTPTKSKPTSHEEHAGNVMDTDTNDTEISKRRNPLVGLASSGMAKERTHKSTRLQFEKTSNIPKPFTLERLIAVLRAIHPDGLSRTKGIADIVYRDMVELERLRLVFRLGTGANAGVGATSVSANVGDGGAVSASRGSDDGVLEEKWKVNVDREVVVDMSRKWGVGLEGWEID